MKLTKRAMILPAASLLLLSGCAQPSAYKDPISKFHESSAIVIKNAENEYKLINKKQRDAEIDTSVNLGTSIDSNIIVRGDWFLIKKDDLNARLDALTALNNHGKLLLALVNSDAPNEASKAVNSLDDAVLHLKDSLKKASPGDGFKDKAGAFATIAGEVTKLVMENKIKEALDKAIILSENDVLSLINLLEEEMLIHLPAKEHVRLSKVSKAAIEAYNKEVASDLEKRKKTGAEIKKAGDDWEAFIFRPDPGFEAMKEAHETLVKYAKSPKTPQNIEELVAAMDDFAGQAKIIADSIKTIQQVKE
jgi:hypothetical protein